MMFTRTAGLVALTVLALSAAPAHAAPAWVAPVDLSDAATGSQYGEVAADQAGDAVAIWYAQRGADFQVVASARPAGGTWSAPQAISGISSSRGEVDVAMNASGDAIAVWTERLGGTTSAVVSAVRTRAGVWQGARHVASDLDGALADLSVAIDAQGAGVVGWTGTTAAETTVSMAGYIPSSGSGPPAVQISAALVDAYDTAVGSDGAGNVNATFDAGGHVYAVTRAANGTWSAPQMISPAGETSARAASATNGRGDQVAAWTMSGPGGLNTVKASTRPAGGTWGAPQVISQPMQYMWDELGVAINDHGDALVSWSPSTGAAHAAWSLQIAARAAGAAWQPAATVAARSEFEMPAELVVTPSGGSAAVWTQSSETSSAASAATLGPGGAWSAPAQLTATGQTSAASSLAADGAGNLVALTSRFEQGPSGDRGTVSARAYDATNPQIAVQIPSTGLVGIPAQFSAAATDTWSGITAPTWKFGDGGVASGKGPLTNTFTRPATYRVTFSASDGAGNVSERSQNIAVTLLGVSALTVTPSTFRAARTQRRTNAADGTGTAVSYQLEAGAPVRFTVQRRLAGRRAGRACVKATHRNRRRAACTRYVQIAGSLSRTSGGGTDRFRFTGRLNNRKLSPGGYRLVAMPRPSGLDGQRAVASFRITR